MTVGIVQGKKLFQCTVKNDANAISMYLQTGSLSNREISQDLGHRSPLVDDWLANRLLSGRWSLVAVVW